ncbi:hypothetical protein VTJ49DRAFT_3516 [Mycothermus thermophilus]|uniref:Uncharacterized protein n=1 Tax=Humicola insolens TaxID=85995 RepID=A0ABR3V7C8_HUMIN
MANKSSELSFLCNPRFGYGLVVGVTQASINATLADYLRAGHEQPLVQTCYVLVPKGSGGDTQLEDPLSDLNFQKLCEARFIMGFQARMGLPKNTSDAPEIVIRVWSLSTWVRASQLDERPWTFSTNVDLCLSQLPHTHFDKLPDKVKE